MKIIISGGGKVGEVICAALAKEENEIVLIDIDQDTVDRLTSKFDILGIVGNGASYDLLVQAGVGEADIFIAASEMDEVNIIAAILAKQLGAKDTVARVRNPEYSQQLNAVRDSLGISLLINPEQAAARSISQIFNFPSALSVESFAGKRVNMIETKVDDSSLLHGLSLKDFRRKFGSILVCVVQRGDHVWIPDGDTVLQEGDSIHVTGSQADLRRFLSLSEKNQEPVNSVLIVGGGRLAFYLLKLLEQEKIEAKVIEVNKERAELLSTEFPKATIVLADGTDHDILEEESITDYDAFLSLTGIDEENLILSIFAKNRGIANVITKMSRTAILKVIKNIDPQTIITPKQIAANEIVQFVRARANTQGSNVEALYQICDNQVEALQFRVKRGSKACGIPLAQLPLKSGLLVAFIVRGRELIYPGGGDSLQAHDRVIVVTTQKDFDDIEDLLEV